MTALTRSTLALAALTLVALALAACSHADESATTPKPPAVHVTSTDSASDAQAEAEKFCHDYHSAPAALAEHSGTISRFECTGRARGGDSFFVEQMGL
jgi:hypothetical protein